MSNKYRISTLVFILLAFTSYPQQDIELPQVIGPSPEIAALFHAQEFTVNHSTGVPHIQIPLFTVKSGDISVPITLSYDASGRKVLQDNGPIAMDWVLNVGGVIAKTIYGKPDSKYGRVPVSNRKSSYDLMSSTSSERYNYLSSLFKTSYDNFQGTLYDEQYDIYSYNFAGLSGNFLFKNSYHSDPVFLDGAPLKMGQISSGSGGTNKIEIINSDGIKYTFGGSGKVEHYKGNPSAPESNFVSSLRLSKISSWNNLDEVTFTYNTVYKEFVSSIEEYTIVDQKYNSYLDESMWNSQPLFSQIFKYDVTRIKEINFKQGKLVFVLDSNTDMINAILIRNDSGNIIKTIEFVRSNLDLPNYPGTEYMKKLDAIKFKDETGIVQEEYKFDYYNSEVVKTYRKANRDWWGYKNNQNQIHLLPTYSIYTKTNNMGGNYGDYRNYGYGANRNPSDYVFDGVLKSISYPTKGKTEFEYEKNKFLEAGQIKTGPGLRIKKMVNKDYNDVVKQTQRFEYNNGEFTNFYKYKPPNSQQFFLTINTTENLLETGYRLRKISSEDNTSMSFVSSKPVFYSEVTKYIENTSGLDNGKIVYKYDHKNSSTGSSFQSNSFTSPSGNLWTFNTDSELIQRCMYNYNYWDNPVLIGEAVYKNDGLDDNGNILYNIAKWVSYTYETIIEESLEGMMVEKLTNVSSSSGYNYDYFVEKFAAENWNIPIYYFKDYIVEVGKKQLKTKSTKLYQEGEIVEKTYEYEYNSKNQLKREIESTSSGVISSNYYYPYDTSFGINTKTGMSNMVTTNRIAEPIYVRKFSDQDLIEHQWSTFGLFNSKLFKSGILWNKADSSLDNMSEVLSFHSYDSYGNPLEVSKADGPHIFYLWGYHGQYPIAKIENTTKTALENVLGDLKEVNESDLQSINNLRSNSAFKEAMITTFTYKPLVGMTVMTDPRGRTTTYEYDDFGRLEIVKDHEGKLLEEYQYHYKSE
ncbi:RHS repeat domain-containing protein [Zunongwangia profunda]|jgi:hypothetical protein|uniref:RHS repeat domain-containing protein n=2 Tax=Zunongwangia profunda TaxID=398743 RepID=UPI001D186049|nr:RHS repeat domain-containing protein [Zunongwangia profunda]MCC4229908.1 RHS repeat protein [Zunongwangia profunda]